MEVNNIKISFGRYKSEVDKEILKYENDKVAQRIYE